MKAFADYIIGFNRQLDFNDSLPDIVQVMNPYKQEFVAQMSETFYQQYYSDTNSRHLILGINPGRHGAGITGIPFTDSKRLQEDCGISTGEINTYEVSAVFVYEVIRAFGGCQQFYSNFYINSPCPLGLIRLNDKGNWINCNYYDSSELISITQPFIERSMQQLLSFPVCRQRAIVLGRGKNLQLIEKFNQQWGWFEELIGLEHPRYIMQYKSKQKQQYIDKYLEALSRLDSV